MRRAFFLSVVGALCLGCGAGSPTVPDRVNLVWVKDLANIYRKNPNDRTFMGKLVQCQLEPGTYRIEGETVHCLWMQTEEACCVCFECVTPMPEGTDRRIVVTGRCSGTVRDGIKRTPTQDWYVRVEGCVVSAMD